MLIKNKKLSTSQSLHKVVNIEERESARISQQEIAKAKQEARAIKQEAESILQESQKKLSEAEFRIQQIIADANLKATEIKEKVYKETLQAAKEESEKIKNRSKELLKSLLDVKRQALVQAHSEIIKIALDLAAKIIKYQASIDPEILKTQVLESIKKATSEADRVQVFVNPADLKTLEQSIPELSKLFQSGIDIVPLTNDSIDQGSCIVETKSGQLDARFSTQLQSLTKLVEHLEVKEPQIEVKEELLSKQESKVIPEEDEENLLSEEPLLVFDTREENILVPGSSQSSSPSATGLLVEEDDTEEEELKKELLSNESLIDLIDDEEKFPFGKAEQAVIEMDPAIPQEDKPELVLKEQEKPVIKETIEPDGKKRLSIGEASERTKEEADELDEGFIYEEEDEDLEEEEEKVSSLSVLKPKKKQAETPVTNIAEEIEKNPEWKNLLQEEDEE